MTPHPAPPAPSADAPWQQQAPPVPHADMPPPAYAPAAPAYAEAHPLRKSPRLSMALSLFPGLGNIYNGLYIRGLIQFLIVGSFMTLLDKTDSPFFGMGMVFFWAFNVLDSYRQAVLINHGYSQDLGLVDLPEKPRPGQGGLIAGIILTFTGIVAFLEEFVDIDLRWLYDLWPLALVGIGIWLIVASLRERRKAAAPEI